MKYRISKLQTEIALRTIEAEYIALSQVMRELVPMRRLLLEIAAAMKLGGGETAVIKFTVFEDNNGALTTSNAINMTPCTKHICVKYHFFKNDCGQDSGITLVKADTLLQKKDIFTKGMAPNKFITMRKLVCKG